MKKTERFSKRRYQELLAAVERGFDKRGIRIELEMNPKGLVVVVTTSSDESDKVIGAFAAVQIQGWLAAMYPADPRQWEAIRSAPKEFLENLPADVRAAIAAQHVEEPTAACTDTELTPEQFWASLPEERRLALAKMAPQVIPAWSRYSLSDGDDRECRADKAGFYAWNAKNIGGAPHATFDTPGWYRYGDSGDGAVGEAPTREEARAAADALVLAKGNRVLA
jgi:hypothetical protein